MYVNIMGILGLSNSHFDVMSAQRIRKTTPEVQQAAQSLRQNLTPAEAHLWEALKQKQFMNLRFRCQHPVGRFILDFYCPVHKLVIEVDGNIHDTQQEYDEARSQELNHHGYTVLRFHNDEVLHDRAQVLETIQQTVNHLQMFTRRPSMSQ